MSDTFVLEDNKIDGYGPVHLLKEMVGSNGGRTPIVKCGATLPWRPLIDRGWDWSGWSSQITCLNCLGMMGHG